MATLEIEASRFRNAYGFVNGTYHPVISRRKCFKFAQTVGNSHFSRAFGRTQAALALSSYRAMAIRCVLDFSQPQLRRYDEYVALESSEKINLSYWIGMTFTAIAAHERLGVLRLTHALRQHGLGKANKKSKSLADLVGQDRHGNWHVFEAKGRQTMPSPADKRQWKAQARTVGSVAGTAVSTRSYCVGLIDDPCRILMVDPPRGRKPLDLRFGDDELGNAYYAPFRAFLEADSRVVRRQKRSFVLKVIAFDPIDNDYIYLGLEKRFMTTFKTEKEWIRGVEEFEDDLLYVGTDGIAVACSSDPCDL